LLAVQPVTLVNAPIREDHPPTPICLIVFPEALKCAFVVPHDSAATLTPACAHVALAVVSLPLLEDNLPEFEVFIRRQVALRVIRNRRLRVL